MDCIVHGGHKESDTAEWLSLHFIQFSSVQFSRSVVSDSLRPHGLQHARPPCPSPSPRVCTSSCSLHRWCYPTYIHTTYMHAYIYVCMLDTHMYAYIHMCIHIHTHVHKHIHMYIIQQNAKSTWMCKIKQENFVGGLHSLQLWHMFLFSSSSKCYCKGCFRLRIIYWELSISQVLCWVIYTHIISYSPSLQILCILSSYALLEMSKWMYDHLW